MPMTLAQAILSRRSDDPTEEGGICRVRVDLAFANDITAPPAVRSFKEMGAEKVFDPGRCAVLPDHFTPNKDIAAAQQTREARDFALEQGVLYWEQGRVGIEHAFLPEQGYILPGEVVLGADSHTCTGGALGAFATGVGSTDLAAAWALGDTWLRVPSTIKVRFEGERPENFRGKDMILALLSRIGVQGARYMALEFSGEALSSLPMDDRFTVANMAVETGAKTGLFVPDEKTLDWVKQRAVRDFEPVYPEEGARYEREMVVDVSGLTPLVALPHSPANVHPALQVGKLSVDQVFIGSCTNGRLSDLEQAAKVLRGREVHPSVRCIVIPATREIFADALRLGYIGTFIDAGAVVCTPTCGPCLGGHMGILADGERCISTSNRNFVGRMGHTGSEVVLSGPLVAAASAVTGRITDPSEVISSG
ncbi:MAG TPA: 3-isopropylmalate dehydratase large subunit [Synergistaceae bacterium]|nr:3-isopropylmalate dehydratase large subunit [Synergistaceae bacterium]